MATLETYLSLNWRIGRSTPVVAGAPAGAVNSSGVSAYQFQPSRTGVRQASPVNEVWAGPQTTFVSPVFSTLASATAGMVRDFVGDFYFRIWVIPDTLQVQNPRLNTDIPFLIWNAYPYENDLTAINLTDADGLELDVAPIDEFRPIELRTVNIQITPDAPIQIDAILEFVFTEGSGFLYFAADIADFVQMVPDPPVQEVWSWLTDVIPSRNGDEQRIALRATPRRSIKYSFMLENEVERRRQYNRWFKSLSSRLVLPYYQYATSLLADAPAGSSRLYFDPARTDLREGEFALIYDGASEQGYLIKLGALEVDGANLDAPTTFDATTNMIVSPAFTSRLQDRTGLSMEKVTGKITVQGEALTSRASFTRPGSVAAIATFDGHPVLDLRPISVGDTPETFDANYEVIDGQTGIQDLYTAWPHPAVGSVKKWTIRRLQNPVEMDWWRDFLDAAKGQQNPFLLPTWFADLYAAANPSPSTTQLTIAASDYGSLYFPYEAFKRLQIETAAGIIWRKVLSVTDNPDGTATLELDQSFGATADDVAISKISFLNLVRLSTDAVTLLHERIRTQIELATRTIDA